MPISFFSEETKFNLPKKIIIKNWLKSVINQNKSIVGDINFIFCSDEVILKINNQFLKHNYYTDIITFPLSQGNRISADIYISIDTVKSNSEKFKQSFSDELNRVMVHGVLHLLNFNDTSSKEKKIMTSMENLYLEELKILLNASKI